MNIKSNASSSRLDQLAKGREDKRRKIIEYERKSKVDTQDMFKVMAHLHE
jgi:hypothetical protein